LVVTVVFWVVVVARRLPVVPWSWSKHGPERDHRDAGRALFWELVWGTTGLFLAMPIMAGVKAILYHVPEWRVWQIDEHE